MTEFDAAEIARGVGELYEPLADDKGLALKVEAPAAAPVRGNRELISQALANLVDNAIKYAAPERRRVNGTGPKIVVKATGEGDRILLTVADGGRGIPEADRGRVVERFVRLEQSRSQPGSGLGLSLPRRSRVCTAASSGSRTITRTALDHLAAARGRRSGDGGRRPSSPRRRGNRGYLNAWHDGCSPRDGSCAARSCIGHGRTSNVGEGTLARRLVSAPCIGAAKEAHAHVAGWLDEIAATAAGTSWRAWPNIRRSTP